MYNIGAVCECFFILIKIEFFKFWIFYNSKFEFLIISKLNNFQNF